MKNSKYIFSTLALVFLLTGSSCKKDFFTDVNDNPNTPPAVVPYVLLTSVEGALGFTQTSTHSFFTAMFTQQVDGYSRQAYAYYNYVVTSEDLDDPWSNWYTSVMETNMKLIQLADSRGDNQYSGVSRILMAFSLQQVVDAWGKVPYSQAFKGLENLHPAYDDDAVLYTTMIQLLNDAIAYLQNPVPGIDNLSQHDEDVMYKGDVTQWIAFAHAIKARLYIHQSKGNPAMATNAIAEVTIAIDSGFTTAKFPFGTDETAANAMYQYNENRADLDFTASTLANSMAANTDPRYQVLLDSTFNDINGVGLGDFYGAPDAPAIFIPTEELLFISAEAKLRATSDFVGAQADFTAAIQANMDRLGVSSTDAATYIATYGTLSGTSVDSAIASIAYEEWIALYLNPEAWTLWRRTNAPALSPVSGNQIPRRFPYTQTEYTYNGGNVPASTLFEPRIFWDH